MESPFLNAGPDTLDHESAEHWFSFGDSCLAICESAPVKDKHPEQRHVLFFLHGRFGQGEMWSPLMSKLATHFRCFQLDFPGFGRSFSVRGRGFSLAEQAQIVKSVIRRFLGKGKKAVLVGHDIGGAVAQLCSIDYPEIFSGLVLINSVALTQEPEHLKPGFMCLLARRKLKTLLRTGTDRIDVRQRLSLLHAWENRIRRKAMFEAFQTWEFTWPGPFERHTWRKKMSKLPHPVLLLWGRKDSLNPPEAAEEMMRYLPEAYLFENDECGHWPCLENTDWVDWKMREFLFRLDSRISDRSRKNKTAGL